MMRAAIDETRHPYKAFFGVVLAPIVLIAIANWDMLPATGWGWIRLIIWVAAIVFVHLLWAVGPRFALFVRQTYDNPYNAAALQFLGQDASSAQWRRSLMPIIGRYFKTVVIPVERRNEWIDHWKVRSEELRTTFKAPAWWDEKVRPRIAEWTLLAPLSVMHIVWELGLDQAFWGLVNCFAWIATFRTYLSYKLREEDLTRVEDNQDGGTVVTLAKEDGSDEE
jgi:hypothetical protein